MGRREYSVEACHMATNTGNRSKGRPKKTYVDLLEHDTGYPTNEVENSMLDRRL